MKEVDLDLNDIEKIIDIAKGRQRRAEIYNRQPKYGQPKDNISRDNILGVLGEYAYAKYFNIPYDGNGPIPDDLDVGDVQIRTTYYLHGKLIANPSDPENRKYVLVWGDIESFRAILIGWTTGDVIKQPQNWGELSKGRECYSVSQSMLNDIDTIYKKE
jgi:hypothetical protein